MRQIELRSQHRSPIVNVRGDREDESSTRNGNSDPPATAPYAALISNTPLSFTNEPASAEMIVGIELVVAVEFTSPLLPAGSATATPADNDNTAVNIAAQTTDFLIIDSVFS